MNWKRRLALLLIPMLLGLLLAPCALAAQERTVHIASVEDLRKLAADCVIDSYSRNLTVILDQDLDLSEAKLYPIPSFGGSFEGCGHWITGLQLATDGSHQGLFRYIQEGGAVRELNLKGSIRPENGRCQVGGLAGTNRGLIESCSFEGSVSGKNEVGGLVGENLGTIRGCRAFGTVEGKRYTGGIAGRSEGLIEDCVSVAKVNTSITEGGLELTDLSLLEVSVDLTSAEDENVVSDSGGIAGFSTGVILKCVNRGEVGYPHYGYNVGGIAGRQSGYLNGCENRGSVVGRKDVGGVVGQMEPFLVLRETVNLADELRLLNFYMNRASDDIGQMSDEMQDTLDEIDASSRSAEAKLGTGTISHPGEGGGNAGGEQNGGSIGRLTDDDLQNGLDYLGDNADLDTDKVSVPEGISEDLNSMADGMNALAGIVGSGSGILAEDLADVNNQLSRCLILMANALNGAANRRILRDVSDGLPESDPEGRVCDNVNLGTVEADRNVGGIAGDMGIEYEFDLEGRLNDTIGFEGIVTNTYDTKCVSDRNVNRGGVTARKEAVGGVVGLMELGAVIRCEGYGNVGCDGSYVGGIAGNSRSVIRDCYAMCDLEGKEYVGGIVGYGTVVTGCGTMVGLGDVIACAGSIAGFADVEAEDAIADNVYVHDSLGAVDGISYEGKAMPIDYQTLMAREDIPSQFKLLKMSFLADGELVAEIPFSYGGSIDESQIPKVPEKEGFTGAWPERSYTNLTYSDVVEAVYTPRQGALAASATREGSPMSIVLIEGDFDKNSSVQLNPFSGDDPELENGAVLEKWVLRVAGLTEGQHYSIRFLPPAVSDRNHRVDIYLRQDGDWVKADTSRAGSYLSFESDQDTVIFAAVEVKAAAARTVIYGSAAALAALGVALVLILGGRKKKTLPPEESGEEKPETADAPAGTAEATAEETAAEPKSEDRTE